MLKFRQPIHIKHLKYHLKALKNNDARENYALFLRFRDDVENAGSLEAAYMGWMRSGQIQLPPLFIDLVVQADVPWPRLRRRLGVRAARAPQSIEQEDPRPVTSGWLGRAGRPATAPAAPAAAAATASAAEAATAEQVV